MKQLEAKDLRIGNLVINICNNEAVEVVIGVFEDEIYLSSNSSLKIEDLTPIPLTEEWLLKLGLVYNDERKSYGNETKLSVLKVCSSFVAEVYEDAAVKQVRYVHELQNLYHAITGNELEIKQ